GGPVSMADVSAPPDALVPTAAQFGNLVFDGQTGNLLIRGYGGTFSYGINPASFSCGNGSSNHCYSHAAQDDSTITGASTEIVSIPHMRVPGHWTNDPFMTN